ncbi:MAG: Arc family DNA-binding protein [Proteobacteria bacterium]|nr:Arc family DNA-binding protein [Pseudomonadota bacterium]
MSQNASSFHVRLPESLKNELQQARKGNDNSLNQEIVLRLQSTLKPDAATRLANEARPLLDALDDNDREAVIRSIITLLSVTPKPRKRR